MQKTFSRSFIGDSTTGPHIDKMYCSEKCFVPNLKGIESEARRARPTSTSVDVSVQRSHFAGEHAGKTRDEKFLSFEKRIKLLIFTIPV